MPRNPPQLAKLARPIAEGLLERERLFAVLDQACRQRTVWVKAPAGAGKTSLVSSYLESRKLPCLWYQVDAGDADLATFFHYLGRAAQALSPRKRPLPSLTPEYLLGIETFVRRFFRLLFERLAPPFALVLDNFHEASADSPLQMALAAALNEVPPGNTVLFVSRYDPPALLARGYANSGIIDWEDLKLTQEEATAFARHHGHANPDTLQPLIDAAQGWIAGLVLLARTPENGKVSLSAEMHQPQVLYDYFAQEVLTKIPVNSHDVLLKTAILPDFTADAARKITGLEHATHIIEELHRDRFFIDRHSRSGEMYSYHPLFRAFLLKHGVENYSDTEFSQLKQLAARILEGSGQIEAAVELFIETAAWDESARLIGIHAPALLEQGRNALLERWIKSLPASLCVTEPWLLYWRGVSRMPFSPPDSRVSLEPAFALFKAHDDVTGMYLALGALLTSYFYEWGDFTPVDRWLAELETLMARHPDFPSIEVEAQVGMGMMSLVMHCPQHPLIRKFKERTLPIMRLCTTPQQQLSVANPAILYCLWSGEFLEAGRIIDELKVMLDMKRISPVDAIALKISESKYAWRRTAHAEAFDKISEANELARNTGVHILDCQISAQMGWAALGNGDLNLVTQTLADAKSTLHPARRADRIVLYLIEYGLALLQEKVSYFAIDVMRGVVEEAQKIATLYGEAEARILYSQLLIEVGEHIAARREFVWLKDFAKAMPSPYIDFRTLMIAANSAFLTSEEAEGLACLRQALAIGREKEFFNCHPGWQPKVMSRLLTKALEAGIEMDYVQHFIRVRDLKAPSPDVEQWPGQSRSILWVAFSVLIDDQPLLFQGKTQKKPLELLKCLIAHGGRGVSQGVLSSQLWPDLEGDADRNAYDLALHRLRKLLKRQDALEVHEGKLTLNASVVWVDAWVFERLCGSVEAGKNKKAEMTTAQSLLRLYPGHFLEGEEAPWTLAYRERLNSKFQRNVTTLAQKLVNVNAWEEATALYRQAIELDPLAEEFYLGLILSYRAQGRIAEALDAYRHCRDMLSIVLGIEPSLQTPAVYRSLKSS